MKIQDTSPLFERPTDVSQPSGFFIDYIDTITGGLWSVSLPIFIFAITYLSLNQFVARKAYGAASFSTMVIVVMLVGLGALQSQALVIAILMVVMAVVLNRGGRV